MRSRLLIFVWIIISLVACSGTTDEQTTSTDQVPIERVQAFVAATEARNIDAMLALLTPDVRRDAGWQLRQQMPMVESIEYRDPRYTMQSNDGVVAFVEVAGLLIAETADGESYSEPVTQLVELNKIDGEWFISSNGIQLPQN